MGETLPELPEAIQLPNAAAADCARLCRELLWLRGDPELARWGKQLARVKGLTRAAEKSPMLRVLLQVAAMVGAEALLLPLRTIYSLPLAAGWLDAEVAEAKQHGIADLLTRARGWLGIERRRRARRPFAIAGGSRSSKAQQAPVTVLVVDLEHSEGIEDTLRSVESQTQRPAAILPLAATGTLAARISLACKNLATPYVALLAAGTSYHRQRIETCLAALQQASQPSLVCTGLFFVDAKGKQISAAASSRLEQGSAGHAFILDYEHRRPRTGKQDQLVDAFLASDFVLSLGNLVCHRDYLQELTLLDQASDRPLCWQLALRAALDRRLLYLHRKLGSLVLPGPTDLPRQGPGADRTYLQLTRAHSLELTSASDEPAAPEQPSDAEVSRIDELDRALALALAEKDRMHRDLDLLTCNRDRLEQALASALTSNAAASPAPPSLSRIEPPETAATIREQPRSYPHRLAGAAVEQLCIAAPLPPDQDSWREFYRLCQRLGARPHVLHWQGEASRLASGTVLHSDADAQLEDLAYLRRSLTRPLKAALSLFSEALELPTIEVEGLVELRRAFTFARKIEQLAPDYLHCWDLNQGSTATLLAQLVFGIRRGLVLRGFPKAGTFAHKILPLQLAAVDFVIAGSDELARELILRGLESEKILLGGSDAEPLLEAVKGIKQ